MTRSRPIIRPRPATSVPAENPANVVSDMQMQRHLDDQPCPDCGGDRLRLDFVTKGRCHVPKEES